MIAGGTGGVKREGAKLSLAWGAGKHISTEQAGEEGYGEEHEGGGATSGESEHGPLKLGRKA